MMKRTLLILSAALLLAACQKQLSPDKAEEPQSAPLRIACYPSGVDTARIQFAQAIASCIQSASFYQGLSDGLAIRRDGDNEVLVAEIFQSSRTRGEVSWNREVAAQLAAQFGSSELRTRGTHRSFSIESMLKADPLAQVLYVPAYDNYAQKEVDLSNKDLKIVVVPSDYDDQSNEPLLAFDRLGNEVTYDPSDEASPLLVVGKNERLVFVPGPPAPGDAVYLRNRPGTYLVGFPPDNGWGGGGGYIPPMPKKIVKRGIRTTSENIVRARFTSTKAMRKFESRVLGRPEVQYNAQMISMSSGLITGEKWKDGDWVSLNAVVGRWTLLKTVLLDFYTVAWVEIDNFGHGVQLKINSIVAGVPTSGEVSLTYGDDQIGSQAIYYEDPIDNDGYGTYTLGNTFQFVIQVRED